MLKPITRVGRFAGPVGATATQRAERRRGAVPVRCPAGRRLRTRRANVRKAASEPDEHWHPRHRYAEAFGAHAAWFHARDEETPEEVEATLM